MLLLQHVQYANDRHNVAMATIPYRWQPDRLLSRSNELCSHQLRLLRRGQRYIHRTGKHHLRWIHMYRGGVLHDLR